MFKRAKSITVFAITFTESDTSKMQTTTKPRMRAENPKELSKQRETFPIHFLKKNLHCQQHHTGTAKPNSKFASEEHNECKIV